MRKNKAQSFKIIRKNGKQHMTHMSKKGVLHRLRELASEWRLFLRTCTGRLQALWVGNNENDYVALSSGRLHGGMQMGRR